MKKFWKMVLEAAALPCLISVKLSAVLQMSTIESELRIRAIISWSRSNLGVGKWSGAF